MSNSGNKLVSGNVLWDLHTCVCIHPQDRGKANLNGVRNIEPTAFCVTYVQPGMALCVVQQVPQLLIVDLQQLDLNLVLTL